MNELRIGIIDDDSTKVTQISTLLLGGWETAPPEKRSKYSGYTMTPVEINIHSAPEEVIDEIRQAKIDCILIDYRLSSYANVSFNGTDLADALLAIHYGFPLFILTSYEDDIYAKEIFDTYQIFNFDRYMNDADERIELNTKIIEQILKHRRERKSWEQELESLLPHAGIDAKTDARILQLDGYIEKTLDGAHAIPEIVKQQLSSGKIEALLDKLDSLIMKG